MKEGRYKAQYAVRKAFQDYTFYANPHLLTWRLKTTMLYKRV